MKQNEQKQKRIQNDRAEKMNAIQNNWQDKEQQQINNE
jgi:hypothetical protein